MEGPQLSKLPKIQEAKQGHAHSLVELVWSDGKIPQSFDVEYEGADWEVTVRLKQTEDAPLRNDSDFMSKLPE
jgi:hypothetical protein